MAYTLLNKVQRKLFFEGHSHFARGYGTTVVEVHYMPNAVYAGRTYSGSLCMFSRATGGRRLSEIVAAVGTNILPYLRAGDVIFLLGAAGDIRDGVTPAQIQALNESYAASVLAVGAKLIIGTTLAMNSGEVDLELHVNDSNTLLRNNAASVGYTVCDFASDSHFDSASDASNLTYYLSDTLHLTTAGYDIIVPMAITTLNTVLAS